MALTTDPDSSLLTHSSSGLDTAEATTTGGLPTTTTTPGEPEVSNVEQEVKIEHDHREEAHKITSSVSTLALNESKEAAGGGDRINAGDKSMGSPPSSGAKRKRASPKASRKRGPRDSNKKKAAIETEGKAAGPKLNHEIKEKVEPEGTGNLKEEDQSKQKPETSLDMSSKNNQSPVYFTPEMDTLIYEMYKKDPKWEVIQEAINKEFPWAARTKEALKKRFHHVIKPSQLEWTDEEVGSILFFVETFPRHANNHLFLL